MKIAFSSDWHFHSYKGPLVRTDAQGQNSRLLDILECAEWAITDAIARGATAFYHGGDLTHNRLAMANEAWARVAQFMRIMGQRIPTSVLVGNHDLSASGDGTSTVAALDGFIDSISDVRITKAGKTKIGWLPYAEHPDQVRAACDKLSRAGATVLVAHLGLGDPKFSNCVPADYEVPGCINVADLLPDRWDQVFLGHYHTSHEILPHIRYMGSPLQLSFKEAGTMKGYWLLDTETNEVEFVENTVSPVFHKLTNDEAVATLSSGKIGKRDLVWVTDATRETVAALADLQGKDAPAMRVDRAPVQRDVKVRVDPSSTVQQQLDQYVRHVSPDLSQEDRAALVIAGDKLMKEALG